MNAVSGGRRAGGVGAVMVCALLIGCGGTDEQAKIRHTITSYFAALASGDGANACAQLTGNERRLLFANLATRIPELSAATCADAVSKLAANLGADETARLKHVEVTNIAINGQTATATIAGATKQATLTKTNGQWLISGGLS